MRLPLIITDFKLLVSAARFDAETSVSKEGRKEWPHGQGVHLELMSESTKKQKRFVETLPLLIIHGSSDPVAMTQMSDRM